MMYSSRSKLLSKLWNVASKHINILFFNYGQGASPDHNIVWQD
jgi:hypothetical protein